MRWGPLTGLDTGTRGAYYLDDFVSQHEDYIGGSDGGRHVYAKPIGAAGLPVGVDSNPARSMRRMPHPALKPSPFFDPPAEHTWTSYYYAGAQRIAERVVTGAGAGVLYYLHGDHLGSTSLVTCGTAGACGGSMLKVV